jgi:hypothetical protein
VKQSRVSSRSGEAQKPDSPATKLWHNIARVVTFTLPHLRRLGRPAAFVLTGVLIAFDSDHGNLVGLWWALGIAVVSLAVRDDVRTSIGRIAWWTHAIFAIATLLGLIADRLSPQSALSLAIALVTLEGIRAALRREYISSVFSAALLITLTVLVTITDLDTRHATGAIGVWAIVIGIFTIIRELDGLIRKTQKETTRVTK